MRGRGALPQCFYQPDGPDGELLLRCKCSMTMHIRERDQIHSVPLIGRLEVDGLSRVWVYFMYFACIYKS